MNSTISIEDQTLFERLIRISREKPLDPEKFVPWDVDIKEGDIYLPENLISLSGLPIYDTLTPFQKQELGRHEVVQAMYSYCWGEGLFCVFMNRYILNRDPRDLERQFLIRELIEEFRHQEMFAHTIEKLNGQPIMVGWMQKILGGFTAKFMADSVLFLSCISIEMMADQYGELIRQHPDSYPVLRKVSQLHNIEEARHILFTQAVMKRYIKGIGFWRSSIYSLLVLANMRFLQTIYVRWEIYERIGLANPKAVWRGAFGHYQRKFAKECLNSVTVLVNSFNGFNWLTRPLWRRVMKMAI